MRTAVYPGSFDPFTNGHLDILQTAARLFDSVVVAVLENPDKQPMFSVEERVRLIRAVTESMPNVTVDQFRGLLVDYVRDRSMDVIVRGLREVADYENEVKMAQMNRSMDERAVTVFLPSRPEHVYISSSLVKQVARYGGDVSRFVPPAIADAMRGR